LSKSAAGVRAARLPDVSPSAQEVRTSDASVAEKLLEAAATLRGELAGLRFSRPVTHVYNPLEYAWDAYEAYVRAFVTGPRRVVFLGMNPGPFGMVQTGVPFGEIGMVRDWMKISARIGEPASLNPNRPVLGFACPRSEISGKRLWGLFARRFQSPMDFFKEHVVLNYCPLAFMEGTGRNITPDKLPNTSKLAVLEPCDRHLRAVVEALGPEWLIGVGGFACRRAEEVFEDAPRGLRIGQILHPSPASPAANRDWAGTVEGQLRAMRVWRV